MRVRGCEGARVQGIAGLAGAFLTGIAIAAATQDPTVVTNPPERFATRVLVSGLEGPWEVAWGPDQQLWVTERTGRRVVRINPADGSRSVAVTIPEVNTTFTQDGLLGLVFHADLLRGSGNDFVYVAFTYDDAAGPALARRLVVRRYRYDQTARALVEPLDILSGLPTHTDHVGGRLAFGPDRKLYLTIGDQGSNFGANRCDANHAQTLPTAAQVRAKDWSAYQGKILRLDLDGSIPADNPEIGGVRSHVFSVGHRNPLGLAFGPNGRLYESEHGPSSDDEANLIESGRNYGWPNVAGYKDAKAYVYANWSASSPTPCTSLPRGGGDAIPASVPQQPESAFNHPQFTPPLRTFFTVETGYDLSRIGSATIAPGGLDVYTGDRIPGWKNSLLVLSLIRGAVYRLSLAPDGRSTQGPPSELFKSANRYRDIALNPDGRTIYLATDVTGPSRDAAGVVSQKLANPGSILELKYGN
jgi:PQQ-dependent dehydrogenase (s-GDH family)